MSDISDANHPIEEVEDFLENIIDETRRISRNLSSRMIDEFGLIKALEHLVQELNAISGLKIEGKFENIANLSNEVSVAIYRIVQEAINNAIKYADASGMTISLREEHHLLRLHIMERGFGSAWALLVQANEQPGQSLFISIPLIIFKSALLAGSYRGESFKSATPRPSSAQRRNT